MILTNQRNKKYVVTLFSLFITCLISNAQESPEAIVQYLSGKDRKTNVTWDFYCSDGRNSGEWSRIKVPSNWELQNFGTYNYGHDHKKEGAKYGKEFGLYKHKFDVPKEWEGKLVNIVFEGSMTDTEVRINSQLAGEVHQGGFYRFKYDISSLVRYGEDNVLEIKVSKFSSNESVNEAERYADYWIFGGIYRPVYLEVLPVVHFKRVAVNAKANGELELNTFLNTKSSSHTIELSLLDQDGTAVGITKTYELEDNTIHHINKADYGVVKTWNPESPNLYTLKVDLLQNGKMVFTQKQKIGFRTVQLVPNDGIYVNGERIIMKGVARHSFHPNSGRCLSDEDHLNDVNMMKDMNMNAVRMSHYPPDIRFLEICDSLGLFVLDELGGWQQGYDTIVGPTLIQKLIERDENHPSVIIWDFGNEGGWQFPNEKWFHFYDFQKRPVIFPWLRRNDTDTRHYPSWNVVHTRLVGDDQIFFPTELLHGLYDGGHGASLNEYWEAFKQSPRNAGGILWNFKDEAVWRTDLLKYDNDGNHAPDGILGPNGEKEGSFYTVKEIWSPIQIGPLVVNAHFDGEIILKNEFIYTNLKDCEFSWRLVEKGNPHHILDESISAGVIPSPDIDPGTSSKIKIPLPSDFSDAEVLELKAVDPSGREIYTWCWPIKRAEKYIPDLISESNYEEHVITSSVNEGMLKVETGNLKYTFDLSDGKLTDIRNSNGKVSFSGGPTPVGYLGEPNKIRKVTWCKNKDGTVTIIGHYGNYPETFQWTVRKNGLLEMVADPLKHTKEGVQALGLSFNYPESKMNGFRWMGNGPYRVYKNRLKGAKFGVWDKKYNNTITGQSYDTLVYPEFKGYHSNLYWAAFDTDESDFLVYCESPDIYLKMYNPPSPEDPRHAHPFYPDGDISFLHYIPGIGTKFQSIDDLGPSAKPDRISRRSEDVFKRMKLIFDFHTGNSSDMGYKPLPPLPEDMPFDFSTEILPRIPNNDFNINDFLKPSDGRDITNAVEGAIMEAYNRGGGRVVIPAGKWESGSIHLKSNIDLHISEGAEVIFSDKLEDYLPVVFTRHQGIECYKYSSFIYAYNETNIALTGKGILNGQGRNWKGYNEYKEVGWKTLVKMVAENIPVQQRIFDNKTDHYLPPYFINLVECKKVLIEDLSIQYGPFWSVVPLYCENVVIRNAEIISRNEEYQIRNGDGIVPNSSRNIWIYNCTLNTGDDCIVLKSGRNEDGIRVNRPTEKIVVQNCLTKKGHGGVVFGSEMSGGIKEVLVDHCQFLGTDKGIRMKTARERGGYIKDVYCRNLTMKDISREAIEINMLRYTPRYPAHEVSASTPYYDNIHFENIRAENVTKHGIRLIGLPERKIRNIYFSNINISSEMGFMATDAEDIFGDNVVMEGKNHVAYDLENCNRFEFKNSFFTAKTNTYHMDQDCENINIVNTKFIKNKSNGNVQ